MPKTLSQCLSRWAGRYRQLLVWQCCLWGVAFTALLPEAQGAYPPPGKRLYRVNKRLTNGAVAIEGLSPQVTAARDNLYFRDPEWREEEKVKAPELDAEGVEIPAGEVTRIAQHRSQLRLPRLQVKGRSKQPRVPISPAWLPLGRAEEDLPTRFGLAPLSKQPEF